MSTDLVVPEIETGRDGRGQEYKYRPGDAATLETITFSLDNGFDYDISTLGCGDPAGGPTQAAQPFASSMSRNAEAYTGAFWPPHS